METRCFPSAIHLIHTHQRYLHFHTRSGEGGSGRRTGRGSLCAALRGGALPFARTARKHGTPMAPGLCPAPSSWQRAGWGHCGERAAWGGLHRVWRGAGGATGTAGPVRGEQGAMGHGEALQEGIQLPREPVAARTVPSPGAGAGHGVSSPPAAAGSLCPDARREGGQGVLASPASSRGGERRSAKGSSSSKRRQKKLIFWCRRGAPTLDSATSAEPCLAPESLPSTVPVWSAQTGTLRRAGVAADPQQHPGSALKPRGFRGDTGFARCHVPQGSGAATSPSPVPRAGSANTGLLCLCLGWQSRAWAEISPPGCGSPLLAACSATTAVGSTPGPPCCPGWGLCLSAAPASVPPPGRSCLCCSLGSSLHP